MVVKTFAILSWVAMTTWMAMETNAPLAWAWARKSAAAFWSWAQGLEWWEVGCICVVVSAWYWYFRDDSGIPTATGNWPLVGHALAYKRDPRAFLSEQCSKVGPVFKVNLAGKRMVIIGDCRAAVDQVANAPERLMSARDAVAAVGFAETLGPRNVHEGTDFHKRTLKRAYADRRRLEAEFPRLFEALEDAMSAECIPGRPIKDLLHVVRKIVLRAVRGHTRALQ